LAKKKIILSADVKDQKIAINGWQEDAGIDIFDFIKEYIAKGIKYITCTDISTDGMLTGPNFVLYQKLTDHFPELKIIASGGVGSKQDLLNLEPTKVDGVIVGKAIYEGKIALDILIK
jgi:phosphoribosylformimino-5-aminoimidazole carboxamide ribotide isomerase